MVYAPLIVAVYSGIDGFLGTRGSLMLDLVFLTMFAVVPVMGWSIYRVWRRRDYEMHRRTQLSLGILLLVAVSIFELDIRVHGWVDRAAPSRFWSPGRWNDWVDYSLVLHLACAIPAALLWTWVIARALRYFPKPPEPGEHSRSHRFWGRLAGIELILTSVTGWLFYWLAFVA